MSIAILPLAKLFAMDAAALILLPFRLAHFLEFMFWTATEMDVYGRMGYLRLYKSSKMSMAPANGN